MSYSKTTSLEVNYVQKPIERECIRVNIYLKILFRIKNLKSYHIVITILMQLRYKFENNKRYEKTDKNEGDLLNLNVKYLQKHRGKSLTQKQSKLFIDGIFMIKDNKFHEICIQVSRV